MVDSNNILLDNSQHSNLNVPFILLRASVILSKKDLEVTVTYLLIAVLNLYLSQSRNQLM